MTRDGLVREFPFGHLCAIRTKGQGSDPRMCRRHRKTNNEKRLLHRCARTHTTNSFSEGTTRRGSQEPTCQEQATSFFGLRHHHLGTSVSGSTRHCQREPGSPPMPNRTCKTPRRCVATLAVHLSSVRHQSVNLSCSSFKDTPSTGTRPRRALPSYERISSFSLKTINAVNQTAERTRCDVHKRETGNDNVVREHGKC